MSPADFPATARTKDKGELADLRQMEAGLEGYAGGMAQQMNREETREGL